MTLEVAVPWQIDDQAMRKLEVDEEILRALKDEVIPRAVHLYLSGPLKVCFVFQQLLRFRAVIAVLLPTADRVAENCQRPVGGGCKDRFFVRD